MFSLIKRLALVSLLCCSALFSSNLDSEIDHYYNPNHVFTVAQLSSAEINDVLNEFKSTTESVSISDESLSHICSSNLDPKKSYVLDNPSCLLIPKSFWFVNKLSSELFSKTGYSLYVSVVDKTPLMEQSDAESMLQLNISSKEVEKIRRTKYKEALTRNLPTPYTLIFFMKNDAKMGIMSSHPNQYLDEDKVYFEYMVPLLPKQKDENLTPELISAIVLNAYAQAADMIAENFDTKLENNMPVDESGGREFVRFSMYAMLLIMFGIIAVIYITRKK